MKPRTKIGLALGSGGARGLAHIGVLQMLQRNEVPISHIAGSSIGALVGALFAVWGDADRIENFFIKEISGRRGVKLFDPSFHGGIMHGEKITKVLQTAIGDIEFSDLSVPLAIVATNFESGDPFVFKKGRVVEALRASFGIPPFFEPVRIGQQTYVDGGLSNPVPDDVVRSFGATCVIAVDVESRIPNTVKIKATLISTMLQALSIARRNFALSTTRSSDILIEPPIAHNLIVGFGDFLDQDRTKSLIASGRNATRLKLPGILKLRDRS